VKTILPNLFPYLIRVVFQWIYCGNEIGMLVFTLNDIFLFFSDALREEDFKYIYEIISQFEDLESLTREMIKQYLKEDKNSSFTELIIQLCIKNKDFLVNCLNEFNESDEKILDFISIMINNYRNEFKDSMKQIDDKLSTLEETERVLELRECIKV
jgi:predicted transcriptional regulator